MIKIWAFYNLVSSSGDQQNLYSSDAWYKFSIVNTHSVLDLCENLNPCKCPIFFIRRSNVSTMQYFIVSSLEAVNFFLSRDILSHYIILPLRAIVNFMKWVYASSSLH